MKKHFLLILFLCVVFSGCGALTATNSEQDSTSKITDNSQISTVPIGDLSLINPMNGYGTTSDVGYYYIVTRSDGSKNIKYLDYATQQDVYLCSSPNCKHEDESCTAWLENCGSYVTPMPVQNKLYLIYSGAGDANFEKHGTNSFSRIEVCDVNGQNRNVLFKMETASEWSGLMTDGYSLFALQDSVTNNNGKVSTNKSLVQVSLQEGTHKVLHELDGLACFIMSANAQQIYIKSIFPKQENAVNSNEIVFKVQEYDLNKNILEDVMEFDPLKSFVQIDNGFRYVVNAETLSVTKSGINGENEVVITPCYDNTKDKITGISIQGLVDGMLIINDIRNSNTDNGHDATTLVNVDTGLSCKYPITYEMQGFSSRQNSLICATLPQQYLIETKMSQIEAKVDGFDLMVNIPNYALIAKSDFMASKENFLLFNSD
ncbi:MAG: hypothetical protein RR764_10140 [Oscillospiraceae bacterium]